jgi:hypothetical protein
MELILSPQYSLSILCLVPAFEDSDKVSFSSLIQKQPQAIWMRSPLLLKHSSCRGFDVRFGLKPVTYLAAVLLGAVRAADRRGGDGASQLGVGA